MKIDQKTTKRAKPAPPQVATDEVQVLQFKLTLDDFKPRVYRRVQVRSDMTMGQFAHVIMTLFRMEVSHLYAFAFPDYKVERKVAGFPFPLPLPPRFFAPPHSRPAASSLAFRRCRICAKKTPAPQRGPELSSEVLGRLPPQACGGLLFFGGCRAHDDLHQVAVIEHLAGHGLYVGVG